MTKAVSKPEEDSVDTVGSWLCFTDREMAQLQRKAPSVRKDERRREVLARSLDGKPGQDCSVIAVLRGPRLGMTPEECKKVRALLRLCCVRIVGFKLVRDSVASLRKAPTFRGGLTRVQLGAPSVTDFRFDVRLGPLKCVRNISLDGLQRQHAFAYNLWLRYVAG